MTLNDAVLGSPVFNVVNTASGPDGYAPVADYVQIVRSAGDLHLYYTTSLNASGNIDLCILNSSCNNYQGSYMQIKGPSTFGYNQVFLTSGTLNDPPPAVPEPGFRLLLFMTAVGWICRWAAGLKYVKA